ncbi:MAG: hypothetical protein DMG91_11635 [Acidobacteria bacterium]|nr:MAG: hypothetical protein DMG91_11635 [Acidobacteriota bacterium]
MRNGWPRADFVALFATLFELFYGSGFVLSAFSAAFAAFSLRTLRFKILPVSACSALYVFLALRALLSL